MTMTKNMSKIKKIDALISIIERIEKAFCSTGAGGGRDPTCSPEGRGSGGEEIISRFNSVASSFGSASIPSDFKVFQKKTKADCEMGAKLCHSNALEYAKSHEGHELVVGLTFEKEVVSRLLSDKPEFISSTYHSWVLDTKGRVVDPTLGRNTDTYVGKIVDKNSFEDGSSVRDELFRLLDLD